jgi:superfamily II DNA or RNA helicase|tara:strand:+ start:417 stop:689 length:273 start_codon:yes stop_codon:yes gene_type:complete
LRVDAERDLQAVSCHIPVLDGCRGLDALQKKAFGGPTLKNAVLFATYATLVSAATTKKQSRLDQLVAWCGGPSFDGCVIFDEAHRSEAVF